MGRQCGAGTGCGGCRPELTDILEREISGLEREVSGPARVRLSVVTEHSVVTELSVVTERLSQVG